MAKLKATLTNTPQTFPSAGAPVPHEYRFELSGPVSEERMEHYQGSPSVVVLFSEDPPTPGDYVVTAELLDMAGARIGDEKSASFKVIGLPPPDEEIKITVTYPSGHGIAIDLVEV